MSFRKNRPVLYEVLRRNEAARQRNAAPAFDRPVDDVSEPSNGHSTALSYTISRWTEVASGRVDLSLSYPVIAASVVGLLIAVGLAFWVGKRIGERGAAADKVASSVTPEKRQSGVLGLAEEMRNRSGTDSTSRRKEEPIKEKEIVKDPPKLPLPRPSEKKETSQLTEVEPGTVITPGLDGESKKHAEPASHKDVPKASDEVEKDEPAKFVLERGKYYVQVQWFRKDQEKDASAAAKYLQNRGVPVTLLRLKDNLVLYVREAFDLKGSADRAGEQQRADDLLKKVKTLGREFSKDGGRFTFKDASVQEIKP